MVNVQRSDHALSKLFTLQGVLSYLDLHQIAHLKLLLLQLRPRAPLANPLLDLKDHALLFVQILALIAIAPALPYLHYALELLTSAAPSQLHALVA